ncbi:hypothetical protein ABW19_dt0201871 [Dactylella cylindrospora]|nr:hypothetical protein ABW19_dt0201871 [Dactylella cylindrospora]
MLMTSSLKPNVAHGPDIPPSSLITPEKDVPLATNGISKEETGMDTIRNLVSSLVGRIGSFIIGGDKDVEKDNLVEERQELGYTSHFEGNSRKRRRPTPLEDRKENSLGSQNTVSSKPPTAVLNNRELSTSDRSNNASVLSSSERPSPSTNPTEIPNDTPKVESLLEYAESKWREGYGAPKAAEVRRQQTLHPSAQLQRSMAKRKSKPQDSLFRSSVLTDRVSKRPSTPSSLRGSRTRRYTPRLESTPNPRSRSLSESRPHIWQPLSQYSPPTQRLFLSSQAKTPARASPSSTFKTSISGLRSTRLQEQINISRAKKPWLTQQEPDAITEDPEGLANLIKELQDHKVEGFENYNMVQIRQREIDEKLKAMREPPKEILRDITEPSLEDLHKFLGGRNQDHAARTIGGCPITPRNLKTLSGSQWLNDEVINAYIHLVKERANVGGATHLILLNSMFVTSLKDHGYSRVSRWAKRAGAGGEKILSLDGVIIPIHRNYHWTLSFINVKKKQFEYYDSLAGNWDPISLLREFMKQEVGAKYVDSEWKDYYPRDKTPQQKNGVDCGVFLCKTAEVICRDGIMSFSQDDIPKIRRMMQVELLKGDLAAV